MRIQEARLGAESPTHKTLVSLPPPDEQIVAAVYRFRDQTGQYKASEIGTNFSTAVTQGATSILLRALEESNWFVPIEREGLNNLLNERKIIRSSRQAYEGDNPTPLPPLLFGGILLEGGIISFDSNIMSGGVGARYFGAGASGEYKVDRVTIYLRAISTSNGRILKTVYTSKMILSQKVDVGIFRFVSFERLLEAETGFTFNEPGEMAVKDAIQKAVVALIIEGVKESLWTLENPGDINSKVIQDYEVEKEENELIDVFGTKMTPKRGKLGVGLFGAVNYYKGDLAGSQYKGAGELNIEYGPQWPVSLNLNFGYGSLAATDWNATIAYGEFTGNYRFFKMTRTTPYIKFGLGLTSLISSTQQTDVNAFDTNIGHFASEFGIEYLITDQFGLHGSFTYRYLFNDTLDGTVSGKYNDYYWGLKAGLSYYFFK